MRRTQLGVVAVAVVAVTACGSPKPDSHTGKDGVPSGAESMTLVAGQATAKGVVTYDGGDRTDWKSIELPKDQTGALDVELRWTTPRPGLKVALEVVDEWTLRCARSARAVDHPAMRLKRTEMCATPQDPDSAHVEIAKLHASATASIAKARGTYFVRVYAPRDGDAGTYRLIADFKQAPPVLLAPRGPVSPPPTVATTPDPPPVVTKPAPPPPPPTTITPPPPPVVACATFDPANATCKTACPPGAPATWSGCKDKCVDPADPAIKACQDTMACPRGGDRRVKSCTLSSFPPCPDPKDPDPLNPKCDAKEITARIINLSVTASGQVLTLATGTSTAPLLTRAWTGYLIGADGKRLAGGDVQLIRIDKTLTIVKATLLVDQIPAGGNVRLVPPPRAPL